MKNFQIRSLIVDMGIAILILFQRIWLSHNKHFKIKAFAFLIISDCKIFLSYVLFDITKLQ
ncbi:hypothetical protein WN943_013206 [Citrus x changshan-huyou]